MPAPIKPNVISIPSGPKPITSGPLSFTNMLKMEKTVDAMYAGGFDKFAISSDKAPKGIVKPGFEGAKTYKIPLSVLMNDTKMKGSIFAVRQQNPAQQQDWFGLFSAKGKELAVRQKSGDYAPGFFWSNYQTT